MSKHDTEKRGGREILPPSKVPKVWSSVRRPGRPFQLSPIFEGEPTELPALSRELQEVLERESSSSS